MEYSFWAFLLIAVGRINQLIPHISSLPLAKLAVAVTALALLSKRGKLSRLTSDGVTLSRTGAMIAGIALVLTPVSLWPGASVQFAINALPPLLVATALACAMRKSWSCIKGTLIVLVGCGFLLSAGVGVNYTTGRADVAGSMYDPNDLAYVLVTVIPLGAALLLSSRPLLLKVVYGFMVVIIVVALLLTQSRGGLLGFLTCMALFALAPLPTARSASRKRNAIISRTSFGIAFALIAGGMLVWSHLPESAQERYATLLHLQSDYNLNMSDTTGRGDIWARGFEAFVARPIGYGPQSFEMVDLKFGGKFKAPHNSYLQILVELGIVGLLLFARMVWIALRALQRSYAALMARAQSSADSIEYAALVRATQIALVGNLVCAFFLSDAYSQLLWILFGLTIAMAARARPRETTAAARPS